MKLAISTLLHFAALACAKLDKREHNEAIRDISGSLAAKVSFACTLLKQNLDAQTLFPGTVNYTMESTGM